MDLNGIKNSFKWNLLLLPAITAISLGTNIFLIRSFTLEAYAVYMVLISFKNTFMGIGDFGMATAYTRFFHPIKHDAGKSGAIRFTFQILGVKILLALILLLFVVLFKGVLVKHFKLESVSLEGLFIIAAIIIADSISNVFERYFEVTLQQRILNIIKLIHIVCFALMLLIFFYTQSITVKTALYALLAITILKGLLLSKKYFKDNDVASIAKAENWLYKNKVRFIKSSATIYFDKMSSTFLSVSFLVLLVTPFFEQKDIAYLALAGDFISKAVALFLFPTNGLILPIFSHYYSTRKSAGLSQANKYSIRYFGFILGVAAGLLIVNVNDIIVVLYSSKYIPSVPFIYIFLPLIFFEQAVLSNVTTSFFVKEAYRPFWVNKMVMIVCLAAFAGITTNIKLDILLITLLFCSLKAINIISLTYVNYKVNSILFPWRFYIKILIIVSIGVFFSGFIGSLVDVNKIIHSLILTILYIGFVVIGIRLFSLFDASDKDWLSRLEIPFFRRLKWILG